VIAFASATNERKIRDEGMVKWKLIVSDTRKMAIATILLGIFARPARSR